MSIRLMLMNWVLFGVCVFGSCAPTYASKSSTEEDAAKDIVRVDSFPNLRSKSNNLDPLKVKKESDLLRKYTSVNNSVRFSEILRYEDLQYEHNASPQQNPLLKMTELLHLTIRGSFGKFPSELSLLRNLESLNLDNSIFCVHRISLPAFNSLKQISLRNCQLRGVKGFDRSNSLESINLEGNRLRKIPQGVNLLKNLIGINLNGNPLDHLKTRTRFSKRVIVDNQTVSEVYAEGLDLENSKAVRADLPRLLKSLPQSAFILSLQGRPAWNLPASIRFFSHLVSLNLSHMGLKELPPTFKELKTLRILDLSFNNLGPYLHPLHKLVDLMELNLSHNKLGSWPENYTTFVNLTILDLSETEIDSLPKSFANLYSLRVLKLIGNGLSDILPSCLKKMPDCRVYVYQSQWSIDLYKKNKEERLAIRAENHRQELDSSLKNKSSKPVKRPRKYSIEDF